MHAMLVGQLPRSSHYMLCVTPQWQYVPPQTTLTWIHIMPIKRPRPPSCCIADCVRATMVLHSCPPGTQCWYRLVPPIAVGTSPTYMQLKVCQADSVGVNKRIHQSTAARLAPNAGTDLYRPLQSGQAQPACSTTYSHTDCVASLCMHHAPPGAQCWYRFIPPIAVGTSPTCMQCSKMYNRLMLYRSNEWLMSTRIGAAHCIWHHRNMHAVAMHNSVQPLKFDTYEAQHVPCVRHCSSWIYTAAAAPHNPCVRHCSSWAYTAAAAPHNPCVRHCSSRRSSWAVCQPHRPLQSTCCLVMIIATAVGSTSCILYVFYITLLAAPACISVRAKAMSAPQLS
jgi:hypothetical protein